MHDVVTPGSSRLEGRDQSTRPLRILEIGGQRFFQRAAPGQTDFYWTGVKPRANAKVALGPIKMLRNIMRLRRGEFDLLVVHATQYPPWHPRSFLTALRDWHFRFLLGLFATFAWRFVHWFHKVPIAVIDLDDSILIGRHNFFLLKSCRAFFKRELPSDHWLVFCGSWYPKFPGRRWRRRNAKLVEKLRPISYGVPSLDFGFLSLPTTAAPPEKKADIFFVGHADSNSTVRVAGLEELRALAQEGYVVDVPNTRLPPHEFFERMSAAWLAWSPAGLGWDCGRHYEAPIVGTVPLISQPTILRDAPLRNGEHCVIYDVEPGGLVRAVRMALADKPRLREMAQAAGEHAAAHHTLRARAERVTIAVLGCSLDGTRTSS